MTASAERVPGHVPGSSRSGDAFERYALPEIEVLLRVAQSLTGNTADAEDLVQDTLVRAYRAIDHFDGRHPRAWLLTILRHTHINRNRRRRPDLLRDPDAEMDRVVATSRSRSRTARCATAPSRTTGASPAESSTSAPPACSTTRRW